MSLSTLPKATLQKYLDDAYQAKNEYMTNQTLRSVSGPEHGSSFQISSFDELERWIRELNAALQSKAAYPAIRIAL